jgi:hypothetical protein
MGLWVLLSGSRIRRIGSLGLAAWILGQVVAWGDSISLGTGIAPRPGAALTIPVIVSASQDLAGANVCVEFDPTLLLSPSVVAGPVLDVAEHRIVAGSPEPGRFHVAAWAPPGAPAFKARTGTVFYIRLQTSLNLNPGATCPVRLVSGTTSALAPSGLCAYDGSDLSHTTTDGEAGLAMREPVVVTEISRARYSMQYLQPERAVYSDRTAVVLKTPIIAPFLGQVYIRTVDADKDATGATFLNFRIDRPAVVYVAFDEQVTQPPSWCRSWQRCFIPLWTNDAQPGRVLWKRQFPAGVVTLGANRENGMPSGRSMYSVVIVPQGRAEACAWTLY